MRTPSGSTLAQCIKPGIDNRGHKIVRTLGLMAADEACYQTFQPLFDAAGALENGSDTCPEAPLGACF